MKSGAVCRPTFASGLRARPPSDTHRSGGAQVASSRPTATRPQTPLTAAQRRQMMEATVAAQFETLTSAVQECDVIVALPRCRWRPDRWRRCWGFLMSSSSPMRRWCCRRRIMHHRPCRPYRDRLPRTTSNNSALGVQSVERRKVLASEIHVLWLCEYISGVT